MTRTTVWIVVAASVFRICVASHLPLTEDEAYYWSWSRHLAYGYTDHPPMVAWLIALGAPLGNSPLAVRLPFIFCEAIAALAIGATTLFLSRSASAATAAAAILTFLPQTRFAAGEALPDAPFIMFWATALWMAARVTQRPAIVDALGLGAALGGAVLSRFFGWALVFGVAIYMMLPAQRHLWKRGLWASPIVLIALYAPFLIWNAHHGWENLAFTFSARQTMQGFSLAHLSVLTTARFLVYAALFWAIAAFTLLRTKMHLLAWTALPFPTLLALLAFFEVVDSYWLLGPFVSLAAGIAIAYSRQTLARKRIAIAFASLPAAFTFLMVLLASLPENAQAMVLHGAGPRIKGAFYWPSQGYSRIAVDVRALIGSSGTMPLTDRFEIASELNYHGVPVLLVGSAPQVKQWTRWNDANGSIPARALVITFSPLQNSALTQRIHAVYARVSAGPALASRFAGGTAVRLYTAWASAPKAPASRLLEP